jgi:catechol 2,3-dioxygenase-like lactoylglutathione lyase family enzyme
VRARVSAAVFCFAVWGGSAAIAGQATRPFAAPVSAAAGAGEVRGIGSYSPIVESLDRSLEFYHGLLGLEIPEAARPGPRPYTLNRGLLNMLGTPDGKERHLAARIPGISMTVEILEINNVDRKAVHPRVQDPGAVTLVLLVRDIDALLAHLKQSAVPVVTPGGAPVTMGDGVRAVLVEDPDGRSIELRQSNPPPVTTAPAASNIIGARLSMAIESTDRTMHTYRDLLGFQSEGDASFSSDKTMLALTGLKGGQVRRSRVQAPNSNMWIELLEFKGVDRKPLRTRLQDPGSTRLQVRVLDIDAVINKLKANGATVMSTGGTRVPLTPNLWGALIPDPNNLFLTLLEPCDGCAPRLGPPPEAPDARAQAAAVTAQDRAEIQQLLAHYATALQRCAAREYAELFTPDGVFISDDFRGATHRELYGKSATLVGRAKLIELVNTEEFCLHPETRAAGAGTGGQANRPPLNAVIEPTEDGAKGTVALGKDGRYEDLYVKTGDGWRFKSRRVFMPPAADSQRTPPTRSP